MAEKLKEVVKDKFWIVENSYGKVGTIRNTEAGYEFFNQTNETTTVLDNLDNFKIADSATQIKEALKTYKGLPTNSSSVYPVEHNELPLFRKTEKGKSVYVAGYYILKYEGMGWQHAFCPKLDTVEKYETRGPFLTEWDMNLSLRKARKE